MEENIIYLHVGHQLPADTACDLGRHRERLSGLNSMQSELRRQARFKRGHGGEVHEAPSRLKCAVPPALGPELNSLGPEETQNWGKQAKRWEDKSTAHHQTGRNPMSSQNVWNKNHCKQESYLGENTFGASPALKRESSTVLCCVSGYLVRSDTAWLLSQKKKREFMARNKPPFHGLERSLFFN